RKKCLEVEGTQLLEWRLLHGLDQRRQVERQALAPRTLDEVREQDVFARGQRICLDTEQAQEARDHRAHAIAQRARVGQQRRGRWRKRAQYRQRQAGLGTRRVDSHVRRGAQARYARGLLVPLGQALLPALGRLRRQVADTQALALCLTRVDPWLEIGRRELREGEHQVAEVALRIDADRRYSIDGGFFEQRQAQPRLA